MFQIGQKRFLLLKKLKILYRGHSVDIVSDVNAEETVVMFYEKVLQKTNQKEFRTEKVIKREGGELYVKWKGYDNSFNSWIDKKDMIM